MYGWFSEKQSRYILCEYRTPAGGTVIVTSVTKGPEHGTAWDDIICVGEVTEWVRTIVRPPASECFHAFFLAGA